MRERILIVEDSRTQAEALRFLLEEHGFEVVVAISGEAALEALRLGAPVEIVVSDIVMPGMSGYDLCRTLKGEQGASAPPVILLTTLSDPTDIVRGLECGADNYVTKPYLPEQLLQRIGQVLETRRLRREARTPGSTDVQFMGSTFSISSGKEQILDMLLSSFEELVRASDALKKSRAEMAVLHTRAEDRAERLSRLQGVTEALSRARTSAEVASVVVTNARDVFGADAGFAALLAPTGDALETVASVGYSDALVARWQRIPLDAALPITEAVRTSEVCVFGSASELAERFSDMEPAAHQAVLAAPFVVGGTTLGAWTISFRRARGFEPVDREFFLTLTRQCAQALDRARLFEAERQARAEAEEANRVKAQFLASMSHDLRTPLNAIGGYVELMELGIRGPVTDAQHTDLQRIKRNQQFLLALINDVLNFAKLEAGSVVYASEKVSISSLLRDLEAMVKPQMDAKRVGYGWSPCGESIYVRGDEEKIQQVLTNVAGNALKFTPAEGAVEVSCVVEGDWVKLRIQDSGIGIAADKLEAIFDPFIQVQSGELAGDGVGIGLGLAISRELVRAMGGDLSVESVVDGGSTFTVTLPGFRENPPAASGG